MQGLKYWHAECGLRADSLPPQTQTLYKPSLSEEVVNNGLSPAPKLWGEESFQEGISWRDSIRWQQMTWEMERLHIYSNF